MKKQVVTYREALDGTKSRFRCPPEQPSAQEAHHMLVGASTWEHEHGAPLPEGFFSADRLEASAIET